MQEDLVEGRPAQEHVVDLEPGRVERPDGGQQRGGPARVPGLDGHLARLRVGGAAEQLARGRSRSASACGGDDHPVAAEPALELGGGALGDHPAGAHHGDPVGELVGLVEVLRGEQHRRARARRPRRTPSARPRCAARVQPGGRLVEEQQARAADQAGGDVEAAAHAAGVRRHLAVARRPRARTSRAARRPRARRLGLGEAVQPAEHDEVLAAEQHLVEGGGLADQPDRLPHGGRLAADVVAGDPYLALVAAGEGGEGVDGGALAGAVGTRAGRGRCRVRPRGRTRRGRAVSP